MAKLTEAEKIARYDAERNGTLYTAPSSSATKAKVLAFLDGVADDRQEMAMLGMEMVCYAQSDRPIPDRLHTAVLAEQYERARGRAMAEAAEKPTPAPDERYPDIPLGTIAGCAVIGHYQYEAPHDLFSASLTWNGLHVSTDGDSYINLDLGHALEGGEGPAAVSLHELGGCGDMHLHEWGMVKALARTDVVEQLIALARVRAQRG